MVSVRQADFLKDRWVIGALWHEYLTWAMDEIDTRYGIGHAMLDRMGTVDQVVRRNLEDMHEFAPPAGRLLLAESDGEAVGIGCLKAIGETTGEIKRMFVRPEARRTGAGRRILQGLLDGAREFGHHRVLLDSVRFMTAAHALYRSTGFTEIEPYPESEVPPELWKYWVFMQMEL